MTLTIVLLASVTVGTYLVGQTTNLFPRTQQPQVVEVSDFGNNIQAALDSIKGTGGAIHVPAGTYVINSKIKLFSHTTLYGDGVDKTILQLDESLLNDEDGLMGNDTNYGHKDIIVRDMTLRGLFKDSAKIQCCVGIKLRQLDGGFFYNLKVEGFSWHGIWMVYKKPIRGETLDSVKRVRISNCQILDNKGAGIAMDPPAFDNVIDNCTISGNGGGSTDDKKMTAGIQLSSDADGGIGKNKILNNRVTNNYRGIMVIATNGYKTTDNAICNNTSTGNIQEGISDNNSEDNHYIANSISGNGAGLDGKVYTGPLTYYDQWLTRVQTASGNSSVKLVENSNPGAASIECRISDRLRALPQFTTPTGTALPIYYSYAGKTST